MADKSLYIKPPLVVRAFDWTKHNPKTRKTIDAFFVSEEVTAVKRQMVEVGQRLYKREYVDGNGGNLSVRVAKDLVLCTPTLCSKGFMTVEDICLVDMAAGQLCGYRPATSEVRVHIAMMKAGGVNACVHAHPHCCIFGFSFSKTHYKTPYCKRPKRLFARLPHTVACEFTHIVWRLTFGDNQAICLAD